MNVLFSISTKVVLKKRKYMDPIKDRTADWLVSFEAVKRQETKDTRNGFVFLMLSKKRNYNKQIHEQRYGFNQNCSNKKTF